MLAQYGISFLRHTIAVQLARKTPFYKLSVRKHRTWELYLSNFCWRVHWKNCQYWRSIWSSNTALSYCICIIMWWAYVRRRYIFPPIYTQNYICYSYHMHTFVACHSYILCLFWFLQIIWLSKHVWECLSELQFDMIPLPFIVQ